MEEQTERQCLDQEEAHFEAQCSFQMNIVKSHRLPLVRQAHEAILISKFGEEELLNRKGEWGSNLPPALVLEGEETWRQRNQRKRRRTDTEVDDQSAGDQEGEQTGGSQSVTEGLPDREELEEQKDEPFPTEILDGHRQSGEVEDTEGETNLTEVQADDQNQLESESDRDDNSDGHRQSDPDINTAPFDTGTPESESNRERQTDGTDCQRWSRTV